MKLVVDANILVGELLRQRGKELIQHPGLTLYIAEPTLGETRYELRRRVTAIANQRGATEEVRERLLESAMHLIETEIILVQESNYTHWETEARNRIPRDPNDWPIVALALEMDAAIWTGDCDFLGCGCPTWTTQTLLIHLRNAGT